MSVHVPCPSQQVPVASIRSRLTKGEARQTLERNQVVHKKSQESLREDDSLTSLEWLSSLGNPTSSIVQSGMDKPNKYNTHDLLLLAFRLARQPVLSVDEISEMTCRLNPQLNKEDVLNELHSSEEFLACPNGWKLASNGLPPESKKRKLEMTYELTHGSRLDRDFCETENTIDIVIDRSAMKRQQITRNNTFCPDLSDLLSEIGLPQESLVGNTNPFMQCSSDAKMSETSMAHHLPLLEVTGARIPTPIDWSREHDSMGQISSPDSTDDLLINDVETPYLVESWLQDTFLDYSN